MYVLSLCNVLLLAVLVWHLYHLRKASNALHFTANKMNTRLRDLFIKLRLNGVDVDPWD